jgi:hypothetical protein
MRFLPRQSGTRSVLWKGHLTSIVSLASGMQMPSRSKMMELDVPGCDEDLEAPRLPQATAYGPWWSTVGLATGRGTRTGEQSVAEGPTHNLTGQGPAVTVPAMAPPSLLLWPAGVRGGRGRRDRAGCRLRRHRAMPVSCKPLDLLSHFGTVGLFRTMVPSLRQGSSLFCDVSVSSTRGMHFAHADASASACERLGSVAVRFAERISPDRRCCMNCPAAQRSVLMQGPSASRLASPGPSAI